MLKNLGVPDKDIQAILGHSKLTTTRDIYEHADLQIQKQALTLLERAVLSADASTISRQNKPSELEIITGSTPIQSVRAGITGTLDLNLTFFSILASDPVLTPVVCQLRAHTNTYIFGSLAVRFTVKSRQDAPSNLILWQWISLREALTPRPGLFLNAQAPGRAAENSSTPSIPADR